MGMIALYGPSAHGREGKLFRGKFKPLWYSQASCVLQFEHFFLYVLINMDCLSSMNEQEESVLCTLAEDLCV